MLGDDILHLTGEYVEPAGDDHVLDPIDDVPEAVGVFARHIAGVQPAVPERVRGGLRQVPVPATEQRPGDADLTDFALLHRFSVRIQ